jgi:hypothetical protein
LVALAMTALAAGAAPGAISLLDQADFRIDGRKDYATTAREGELAVGDFNGDGRDDFLISASGPHPVHVVYGHDSSTDVDLADLGQARGSRSPAG